MMTEIWDLMMPMVSISKSLYLKVILLLLLITSAATASAKVYLVSVGVSDYPGWSNDLQLPHNNAATMKWLYDENKNAETVLLMNSQATVSNVMNAMSRLFSKATENDIVTLFISGHGVPGGFMCFDGCLAYSYIKQIMSRCRSKNKMIFADTCYSGSMRSSRSGANNYGGLKGTNVMLFMSCRENEYSWEAPGMTNALFTYALQHGLRGGADYDRNRIITARELFKYTSEKVKQMSKNRQHPVMWGKFPDSMPVMKW